MDTPGTQCAVTPPTLALRFAAPILCTRPGACETALAAQVIAALCAAVHADCEGPGAERRVPRWSHVLRGTELIASDPVRAMTARGMAPVAARIAAARLAKIAPEVRRALGSRSWVGMANAFGVPAWAYPRLRILGALACDAAASFEAADADDVHTFLHRPSPRTPHPARPLALVAAPLGRGELDDDEVLEVLGSAGAALMHATPGIEGWLAPSPRPVCVRAPPEHPGVPLAFVPFVLTRLDALADLLDGTLVEAALIKASRGRYDITPPPRP